MKQGLIILVFFLNCLFGYTQVFNVETIKSAGANDKRINLVILGDGYQTSEFAKFKADAENFVNDMFTQSPFVEYINYFNVHIIKIPSNESGADHPATATDVTEPVFPEVYKDTYFNATFDAFNFHRFLYYGIDFADAASAEVKINTVLATNFPTYDQALILVNTNTYGGTGGEFPISSTGNSANEIAIHELGHSLFNLKDEYEVNPIFYAEAINMTQENNPSAVKWKNWINDNGVGVYQYGSAGVSATWFRPHQRCKMRYLGDPFCSVCKEGMVEKIHSIVSPISAYFPSSNTISASTFPLNFELDLIKPNPNTLESEWTLNTNSFANNIDEISLLETDLNIGTNTLTVVVHDSTPLLRVDNHEITHISTVDWTINYSTLGIESIESTENNLSITLFPNPINSIVNVKIESELNSKLKVDIISFDGKKVKSINLSNSKLHQIDISNLSTGIYLTNFYSGNTLISSKKIIKN